MRFFLYRSLFFVVFFLCKSFTTNADLPFSFGLIMKPYFGFDIDLTHRFSEVRAPVSDQFFNSFYKFQNISVHSGLRIHKYFGIEGYIHRSVYKVDYGSQVGSFDGITLGTDFLFYLPVPFMYLDMLGTGLEFYGGLGPALLLGKQNVDQLGPHNMKMPCVKYTAGLQLRLLNKMSLRVGLDLYQLKFHNAQISYGNLMIVKTGISYYFL